MSHNLSILNNVIDIMLNGIVIGIMTLVPYTIYFVVKKNWDEVFDLLTPKNTRIPNPTTNKDIVVYEL